jgi:hypothetical protein
VHGACLKLGEGVDSGLWDDDLSEADMDLICGVYKFDTGECFTCKSIFSVLSTLRNPKSDIGSILVAEAIYIRPFWTVAWLLVALL